MYFGIKNFWIEKISSKSFDYESLYSYKIYENDVKINFFYSSGNSPIPALRVFFFWKKKYQDENSRKMVIDKVLDNNILKKVDEWRMSRSHQMDEFINLLTRFRMDVSHRTQIFIRN